MQKYVLLIALVAASAAASQSYKGYRVIQAEPQDDVQAEAVRELETWSGVDMWSRRVEAGDTATLMVAPGWTRTAVRKHLEERNVPYTVSNEDVQSMVDREASEQRTARLNRASVGEARFDAYMRYEEIQKYLQRLEDSYFGVSLINIGKSHEGRNLTVIRIGEKATKAKNAIFIDAGIHAREWIAPATALYIIHQLVENRTETRNLILDLDWYILPVANPDGYEYSHSKNRMWRKNRGGKNDNYLSWLWNFVCGHGVDLNRNFGFHYGESGVSSFQCSEIYAGKGAFSEVESQAMRDFILTLNADKSVKMYIALHSYGPMILYPWGYSTSAPEPSDTKKLIALATEANAAMVAAGSTPFKVQNSAKLYAAAGASDDWAKGGAGIEMSFTIELHGGGLRGFDLPVSKITDSVKQAFEGIRTLGFNARFIA